MTTTGLLEIGAVARELGVKPSTLRTWERRYDRRAAARRSTAAALRLRADRDPPAGARPGTPRHPGPAPPTTNAARAAADRISHIRLTLSPERRKRRGRPSTPARRPGRCEVCLPAALVASELVKNAVLYGTEREPIRLELQLFRDWADLCVQNGGGRISMKSLRTRRREGGRGLEIVDALAEAWSIDTGPLGTKISVRLPVETET